MSKLKIFIIAVSIIVSMIYLVSSSFVVKMLYPLEYKTLIVEESDKYNIDPVLVSSIIYEESKFKADAKSKAGAIGLMQLMPSTAQWAAKKMGYGRMTEERLFDAKINIKIGIWYLNYLFEKYQREDLVIAAYNSGHQNVDKWMKQQGILKNDNKKLKIVFGETRDFVRRVQETRKTYEKVYGELFYRPER